MPVKKMQTEMGGKTPLVVLDDAEVKIAVECANQRCIFLDWATLHRFLAADRDRGHPRSRGFASMHI
jgi:acyl-CoA reductase-like NAD-dependent aldehyde dehydrogenase